MCKAIGERITSIEFGEDVTDIVDLVKLENGDVLPLWNGNACYGTHDTAEGMRVGARLLNVEPRVSHNGESYLHYIFGEHVIEIAKSVSFPWFSVLVDGKWDSDCASNSEEETLAAAREAYPDSEVIMWGDYRHYSNR